MTISRYAAKCKISVQAAHKRLDRLENYPEISGYEKINTNFFLVEVNTSKGFSKKRNNVAKIIEK